jgi:pyruvate,orthophosphate dikinase
MQVELEPKSRQESPRSAAPARATSRKTKAPDMAKWVYTFGDGAAEGKAEMKNLLGGKGANLAEMASLGLPVPPGFTISTDVCTYFYANDKS